MLTKFKNKFILLGNNFKNCKQLPYINNYFNNNNLSINYHPEINQGKLELLYKYQNIIKNITESHLVFSNINSYQEIIVNFIKIIYYKNNKKLFIVYHDNLSKEFIHILKFKALQYNINLCSFNNSNEIIKNLDKIGGIIYQSPDKFGNIFDIDISILKNHENIFIACHSDLLNLCYYKPPNVDFIFGNLSNIGVGINNINDLLFFSSKKKYLSNISGNIVGRIFEDYVSDIYMYGFQHKVNDINSNIFFKNYNTVNKLENISLCWLLYHQSDGLKKIANDIYEKNKFFNNYLNTKGLLTYDKICKTKTFDTTTVINDNIDIHILNNYNIFPYLHNNKLNHFKSFTFDETHSFEDVNKLAFIYCKLCNIENTFYINISYEKHPKKIDNKNLVENIFMKESRVNNDIKNLILENKKNNIVNKNIVNKNIVNKNIVNEKNIINYVNNILSKDYVYKNNLLNLEDICYELNINKKYVIKHLSNFGYKVKRDKYKNYILIDISFVKKTYDINGFDISKRLLDYGYYFIINKNNLSNCLIIDARFLNKNNRDKFINAMKIIYTEIKKQPEILKNSPHVKDHLVDWNFNYSIEEAYFPLFKNNKKKYFPNKKRINNQSIDNIITKY